MNEILSIKLQNDTIHFEYFDSDKELNIWIDQEIGSSYRSMSVYLSPNQINNIISHLAEQLKKIDEPISLLTK